jgi:DnaJ-class molecular chaperone
MMQKESPFAILGISRDADAATIRKAYHDLAMKWHPDKNPSPKSQEMFTRINQAYSVLSDPDKRRQLMNSCATASRVQSGGTKCPSEFDHLYNYFYGPKPTRVAPTNDPDGQPRPHMRHQSATPDPRYRAAAPPADDRPSGALDVRVSVECTLDEMYSCAVKILTVRRRRQDGDLETKTIKITLTPGTEDHTAITLSGQGNRAPGAERGDLIITIRQAPHARLTRAGADLVEQVVLTLRNAISGDFEMESIAIDGDPVVFPVRHIAQPGDELRVAGRGMKRKDGGRGDHVFKVSVAIPMLSDEQRRQLMDVL